MAAKPSGEVKTRTVKHTQKNGDIYILERQITYDPITKLTKVLSTKLLSKIPKGSETPVPTRPKRAHFDKFTISNDQTGQISVTRTRIGMMDILDHVGKDSGIDNGIYSGTDIGTAQKIISIARYLLASNGQTLPGILTWQLNHVLPYESGITEDIYHDLFAKVGQDETLQQRFFANRCATIKDRAIFECLRKYRKRETIESFFESMKRCADGSRVRVWGADTLRGRMFVQFLALCYYEYLSNEIRNMKAVLGKENGDPTHDTAKILKLEKKLKSWLENTPVYGTLQWFDTVEGVMISSALKGKRWSSEITERDALFLERLGVTQGL